MPDSLLLSNPEPKARAMSERTYAGHYRSNGNYVFKRRPKLYKRVVDMLADPGYSMTQIENETGVCYHTIRAIYEREQIPIDSQRERLARGLARTSRRLLERIEDRVPDMRDRELIFGFSVLSDRLELLTGNATSRAVNLNLNANAVDLVAQFQKLHSAVEAKLSDANPKPDPKPDTDKPATYAGQSPDRTIIDVETLPDAP